MVWSDQWFTAPVNTPQGLFFSGFSQADAPTLILVIVLLLKLSVLVVQQWFAAPGVTRFVRGASGGMDAAREVTEEMAEICLARNMMLQIPTWDFQGACLRF